MSGLSYTDVACSVVSRATGAGRVLIALAHVTSHAPYVFICECAACGKLRRFSVSSSSVIGPSSSQFESSVCDGASDITGFSGLNSFGEDKSTMF